MYNIWKGQKYVTILILIDGFLQYITLADIKCSLNGHNPYFNRWFSAILRNAEGKKIIAMSQSLF